MSPAWVWRVPGVTAGDVIHISCYLYSMRAVRLAGSQSAEESVLREVIESNWIMTVFEEDERHYRAVD